MTIQRQLSPKQNRRIGMCFRLLRRPGIQDDLRASLTNVRRHEENEGSVNEFDARSCKTKAK
jgi:hypothetical protein